jgi:hypothetical protein
MNLTFTGPCIVIYSCILCILLSLIVRKRNTAGNTKYFPHFLQANAEVIRQIKPRPLPFTALSIHYSHTLCHHLRPCNATYWESRSLKLRQIRNVSTFLPDYTVSHLRRQWSSWIMKYVMNAWKYVQQNRKLNWDISSKKEWHTVE